MLKFHFTYPLELLDKAIGIFYQANKKENTDKYIDSFELIVFSRFTLCCLLFSLFGLHLEFLNTNVVIVW
jgi:hypothetical protein